MNTSKLTAILLPMLKLVKPLRAHMAIAILFGTLGHLMAISVPVLGAVAVLCALGLLPFSLSTLFPIMLLCGLLRGIFAYVEQNRNHYIAFRILAIIRDQVFTALRRLCPAKLEGKERGNLISIITADIELLEVFYAHTISPIAIATLVSVAMSLFLGQFHPVLGVTALLGYLITGVILPILLSKTAQKAFVLQREQAGHFSSYYMDSLRGLSEIQQMGCGKERLAQMETQTREMDGQLGRISRENGKVSAIAQGLVITFGGLILVESWLLLGSDHFAPILLSTVVMLSSFGPVLALSQLSTGLSRVLAAGERVLALLHEEPVVEEVSEGETPDFTEARAQNLTFSYGEEAILRDFTAHFPRGQITGIYGKSGSGKSTLLKLLMGFWSAPANSLTLSGVDVGRIQTVHLRTLETYMTQDTDLFHRSIGDNIRIAKLDATQDEIEGAAKKAAIHDFICSLPQGYDTPVGELGSTLSGGERQRIGLARAFLHDAPLLLLDEPTSNLDSLNEAVILQSLKESQDHRTIILVSHRKSTLSICDRELTVAWGRVG